jgi:hypothetical protein
MYVSRPVRAIRDDPVSGETVRLAVTVTDEGGEQSVRDAVAETDGAVVARRQFGTLVVEVSQAAVAALCDCPGIETIETTAAIGIEPGDAGEDVALDE